MRVPGSLARVKREALGHVARRLYRDTAGGPEHAILVAGVARSGTTWLAEILASQLRARLVFEPFNPPHVQAFGAFEYLQYMPAQREDPALERFVSDVLSGRLRDPAWVDKMVSVLRPEARVVKAVRACLMIRWIHDRFPHTPTILIVRHPCAVVASFAKLGWSARPDLESILRQNQLLGDHLQDVRDLLDKPLTPQQETAAVWCVNHRVALSQCADSRIVTVHYEDLLARPEVEIPRIFQAMERDFDDALYRTLHRPSRTAKPDHDVGWREILGPSEKADVQDIVSAFRLDDLYDRRGRPTGRLKA